MQHAKDYLKVNDIMNQLCVPKFRHSNEFEMPKFRHYLWKKILGDKKSVLYAADLIIEMQFSLELISTVTCK